MGVPSMATMVTLARHAARVFVLCRNRSQLNLARQSIEQAGLGSTVLPRLAGPHPTAESCTGAGSSRKDSSIWS
jgi:hypothetical protein